MALKYIVTGTGRCGTMFMSKFLTSAKIFCGHELIFTNDGIEKARTNLDIYNDLAGESSYMAAPFLATDIIKNAKIIHLVRDPVSVINSFVVAYCYFLSYRPSCKQIEGEWTYEYPPGADPEFKFMKFMYYHLPSLADKKLTAVDRASLYYITWNKMIEQHCQNRDFLFHPIESDISKVCNYINVSNIGLYNNKKTNNAEYEKIYTLNNISNDFIRDEIIAMSKKYGYIKSIKIM